MFTGTKEAFIFKDLKVYKGLTVFGIFLYDNLLKTHL
jgi:hypothetical protein